MPPPCTVADVRCVTSNYAKGFGPWKGPVAREELMRILIVEDSDMLRSSLEHGLQRIGHAVDAVSDGVTAASYIDSETYDLVILDLLLPKRDGLSVLKDMRAAGHDTHVLILSALDQVDDRIKGLNFGADDYLVKPFSFDELCARLQALARRQSHAKNPEVCVGELVVNTASREVRTADGVDIELSPKEYALLELMCRNRGRVMSRAQLMEKTTSFDNLSSESSINVAVCELRRKLTRAGVSNCVRTRRGYGYYVP